MVSITNNAEQNGRVLDLWLGIVWVSLSETLLWDQIVLIFIWSTDVEATDECSWYGLTQQSITGLTKWPGPRVRSWVE